MHVGQQARLALTIDSLLTDVCYTNETPNQDSSSVVQPTAPDVSSRYFLCASGDKATEAAGQRGAGTILADKAEVAILNFVPLTVIYGPGIGGRIKG